MTPELRMKLFSALLGESCSCHRQDIRELLEMIEDDLDRIEPVIDAAMDEAEGVALARLLNKAVV